jgi:solute carrier family 25 phosphate transporter 23/24/25/41
MWTLLADMYKTEGGFPALYRGIIPTIAGVAPYVGLNFMVYEMARTKFTPEGRSDPTAIGKLGAGAVSGAVAQTITYPFDVLRRRFQINTMSGMGFQYTGIFHAVTSIVRNEGLRGMYKGFVTSMYGLHMRHTLTCCVQRPRIVPNLLKVAPSMASSWLSFEMTRDMLTGKWNSGFS